MEFIKPVMLQGVCILPSKNPGKALLFLVNLNDSQMASHVMSCDHYIT